MHRLRERDDRDARCLTDAETEELLLELEQVIAKIRDKRLFVVSGDIVASLRHNTDIRMELSREKPVEKNINEDAMRLLRAFGGTITEGTLLTKDPVDPPLPPIVDPNPVAEKPAATPPGPPPAKKYLRSDSDALLLTLNDVGADPIELGGICHFASTESCLWTFGPILLQQDIWLDHDGEHRQWTDDIEGWDDDVLAPAWEAVEKALVGAGIDALVKNTKTISHE